MSIVASRRAGKKSARGFTLIELMIVVAVVAILAGIAYPAYNDAVRKSRRGQAKADMIELMQMAERYRTVNNTYKDFGKPGGDGTLDGAWGKSPRNGTQYYAIKATTHNANTLVLEAVPTAGGGQDKDKCKTLKIDATGKKESTGTDPITCW
ncbi:MULTISPECIES: type IV pilin protein [unclassified Lysobacter]|uniref:type IV pilin protein n=1 Tax=unclassified Lysobacter TaxID=2635362 RepID=UPI001C226C89|nr:type IV pilin protein [Lysobacter sp. MMG2]MBU8976437.1 type IV pilin protein [Lysobacter sp. MMG2]